MKSNSWSHFIMSVLLIGGTLLSANTIAQVPGRFYWNSLSDSNAVPLIVQSISGNTNPFNPARTVTPGASFNATMGMVGYAHTFSMFDRAATAAVILPMGRVSGDVTVGGRTATQSANGFGDPMLEYTINFLGPRAQNTLADAMRYEPEVSMSFLADLAIPIGEYNSSQLLNLGQNRNYGRVGLPTVIQLGSWVPSRRTTLELLPAVWMFGPNNNYVGQTLKTDPLYQLDGHLTRDLTENFWGSIDGVWYQGGRASINGVPGSRLNNVGVGVTLGYNLNDNTALTIGYKSTINDSAPNALRMDSFMLTLVVGWNPLVEGAKRLKSEK